MRAPAIPCAPRLEDDSGRINALEPLGPAGPSQAPKGRYMRPGRREPVLNPRHAEGFDRTDLLCSAPPFPPRRALAYTPIRRRLSAIRKRDAAMSSPDQRKFVELLSIQAPRYFTGGRVLEVGSLDVNGTVRDYFKDSDYIGIDIGDGPGVDIVAQGQNFDAPDASFDVVLSCECLEHNPYWKATFKNMVRMCKPGGLVIITCASTGRPEHGTARSDPGASPLTIEKGWNYYQNISLRDWRSFFVFDGIFYRHMTWIDWHAYELLFVGFKSSPNSTLDIDNIWNNIYSVVNPHVGRASPNIYIRNIIGTVFGDAGFEILRSLRNIRRGAGHAE